MTLKEHIDSIRERLEQRIFKSEIAVRQGIVDPLLRSLGWPTDDIQVVFPEYPVGSGKVDYALCDPQSKNPRVFIEAKQVGNIEGAEKQLFGYDSLIRVPIAVLTDGQKWQFFHPTGEGTWGERKIRELDFIAGDSKESAEGLDRYLNYEAICTGEADKAIKQDYETLVNQRQVEKHLPDAWKNLVRSRDELLLELVGEATRELCGHNPTNQQVLAFLQTLEGKIKPPIVPPIRPVRRSGGKTSPSRLRVTMDNGTIIEHEAGVDTFIEVIEVLGIEQVLALELGSERHPLVSRKNRDDGAGKNRKSDTSGSYSVYTVFSTEDKKKRLIEIAKRLNRQIKIDIVPKE